MRVIILICIVMLFWIATVTFLISSKPNLRAEPVTVPHCFDPPKGWFMPCSDVDRYEYT